MNVYKRIALVCLVGLVPAFGGVAQTSQPVNTEVMAIVDGVALPMSDLTDILVYSYGMDMAQQLVANELVRQEAMRKKISVGPAEVKAEHERMLELMFKPPEFKNLAERERALSVYMQNGKVTMKQWDLTMERDAILRKLAEGRVKVTQDEVRRAYGLQFGRQVLVRHIQVSTVADAESVIKDLAKGVSFEELVRTKSVSPSRNREGLLDPISAQTPGLPPALKEAALDLKKVGDLSATIQAGTTYHILKLERIIEPTKAKFEDVKDAVYKALFTQKVQEQQMQVLRDLITDAEKNGKIVYVNPILKKLNDDARKTTPTQPGR